MRLLFQIDEMKLTEFYLIPESHNPSSIHGECLRQPVVIIPLQDLKKNQFLT
jgi:hypothetical protein